jgi:hypothetical protein
MMSASNKRAIEMDELRKENQEIVNPNKVKKRQKKVLVFKSNKFRCSESSRNRIDHEKKITSKFKGTPSIFIPEYFNVVN